jgi:hypothetical protein
MTRNGERNSHEFCYRHDGEWNSHEFLYRQRTEISRLPLPAAIGILTNSGYCGDLPGAPTGAGIIVAPDLTGDVVACLQVHRELIENVGERPTVVQRCRHL